MSIWTLAFWKNAAEHSLVAGTAAALALLPVNGNITNLNELKAAAIGFATGFIYALVKQVGGVQAVAGVLKVNTTAKHAASSKPSA